MLKDQELISELPQWYSKTQPYRRMRIGVLVWLMWQSKILTLMIIAL